LIYLETKRLIIRDHISEDLMPLHRLLSNKEVMYFLDDLLTVTLEESKENLSVSICESKLSDRKKYFFAIVLNDTKEYIGEIGFTVLIDCPDGKVVEMGYFILPEFWGKGIVTEAARRVIQFAFEEAGVVKVEVGCNKSNIGSERIMQKLGLIQEAAFKKHSLLHNRLWDRVEYRLLKEEWDLSKQFT
jgi:ribosomal-protein-alanine N-acetyltransferase